MLLRHSLYYLIARGLPGLVNFAALAMYTRLLTPEDFGRYSLVIASVSLIHVLAFQWLQLVLTRFLPAYRHDPQIVQRSVLALFLLFSSVVCIVGLGAALFWSDPVWRSLLAFAVPLTVAEAWLQLNLRLASTQLKPSRYGLLLGGKSLIAVTVGGWAAWLGLGAAAPLLGLLVGASVAWLLFGYHLWHSLRPRWPSPTLLKDYASYGLPLIGTCALGWIIASSDRLIIAWIIDEAATGIYAVGYDLAQHSLGLLLAVANTAAYPLAIRKFEREGKEAARSQLAQNGELIATLALTGAVGLAVIAPVLTDVMLGPDFREEALDVIPWIAAVAAIAGIKAFHFDLAFQLMRKSYGQLYVAAIAALSNIVLNFFLIPVYGIIGAAWASFIAYAMACLISWRLGKDFFDMPPVLPMLIRGAAVALSTGLIAHMAVGCFSNSLLALMAAIVAGAITALVVAVLLDVAGIRTAGMRFESFEKTKH